MGAVLPIRRLASRSHHFGLPAEKLPDDALLAGLGADDPEASLAFVRRFQGRVFGVALAIIGERHLAEDVAIQAFERAWRHAGSYDPRRASVYTWLATITRNLALDMVRVRYPRPIDTEELLMRVESGKTDIDGAVLAAESANDLRRALARLPRDQARALVLASIAGFSAAEVAEREGIPLGTAKTRIRSGLHRLRAELAPEHAPEDADHG